MDAIKRLWGTKTFKLLGLAIIGTLFAWQQEHLGAKEAVTMLFVEVWGIFKRDTDAKAPEAVAAKITNG